MGALNSQVNDASQGSLTVGTSAVITHTVGEPIVKEHTAVVPTLAYYGKREAEAAPEAKADPWLYVDTTAMDSATVATMAMASATAMVTTERGVLMLRLRLIPTSCTVATTAMDLDMATLMEPDTPTTDKVLVSPCLGFVSINPF